MNEETQMVLLEHREYLRLKANSDNFLKNRSSHACSCKDTSKKDLKNQNSSVVQEGFGEIEVPEELPSKFLDKPDIYAGAKPDELQKEAGSTSKISEGHPNNSSKEVKTDSTPWYYIGKL